MIVCFMMYFATLHSFKDFPRSLITNQKKERNQPGKFDLGTADAISKVTVCWWWLDWWRLFAEDGGGVVGDDLLSVYRGCGWWVGGKEAYGFWSNLVRKWRAWGNMKADDNGGMKSTCLVYFERAVRHKGDLYIALSVLMLCIVDFILVSFWY